ncbi:MAG: hypothetical protein HND51_10130 [Chloroflexi bacterium]|nr:hypothetical protein [Chloroflexota bacterium]
MHTNTFPTVSGKNLDRKKLTFPKDFPAPYNLALMAFYQRQQLDVNTWLPFADQLDSEHEDFTYIEFPVVYKMNPIQQFFLNEGMRAGIPNQKAREKTITLYLDKTRFLGQLGIDSQNEIQILLVTQEGQVIWREAGIFTSKKKQALESILQQERQLQASNVVS